jgi:hypothetical protein
MKSSAEIKSAPLTRAISWLVGSGEGADCLLDAGASPPRPREGLRPSDSYWLTRFVFLRLLGVVYFFAFLSLAQQVIPLIGHHGLLPAHIHLEIVRENSASNLDAWTRLPTIFWISVSDSWLQGFAWLGVALSLVLVLGFANQVLLGLLWALYLSFVHVGQEWYAFGWEIQLLETGFLAIFVCSPLDPRPFPRTEPPKPTIWLLRWLIFRIMLGAGLIKIRGDSCWRDLTCLLYHYETQPLPNPLSRYVHFAPAWFHELGCLGTHFAELVAPFFVFGPPRIRRAAGAVIVGFQGLLIASGNLSFLNYLTICPAIACFDDAFLRRFLPRRLVSAAEAARTGGRSSRAQLYVSAALLAVVGWLSIAPVSNLLASHQVMNTSFDPLHLVNTYGAFGSVGRERFEIVLEGTDDAEPGPTTVWRAYEFKAKPGDPARRPPIVAPYHYRVDWLIWFAAMASPNDHPWLIHLIWKLLHNDPLALDLIANQPFPGKPPRWIRADLYRYRFAPLGSGAWWTREKVGPWLPALSGDDDDLRRFIASRGWLDPEPPK